MEKFLAVWQYVTSDPEQTMLVIIFIFTIATKCFPKVVKIGWLSRIMAVAEALSLGTKKAERVDTDEAKKVLSKYFEEWNRKVLKPKKKEFLRK